MFSLPTTFSGFVWCASFALGLLGLLAMIIGAAGLGLPTFIWMYILFTLTTTIHLMHVVYKNQLQDAQYQLVFQLSIESMLLATLIQVSENHGVYLLLVFCGAVICFVLNIFWIALVGSAPGTLTFYLSGQSDEIWLDPSVPLSELDIQKLYLGTQLAEEVTPKPTQSDRLIHVRAHYPYEAQSVEEVSFAKGELMEVLNSEGNWWKVLKGDGTVGLAPSNYLGIVM